MSPRSTSARSKGGHDGKEVARRPSKSAAKGREEELSTKEAILLAAAEAFASRGCNGVNLADVVEELGYTKGALYFYFPNKEALITEITQRMFKSWEHVLPAVVASSETRLQALIAVTYVIGERFQVDPITRAGSRLSYERNLTTADVPEPFVGWIGRLTKLVKAAQRSGEIRKDLDANSLAKMLVEYFYGAELISDYLTERLDLLKRLDFFWDLMRPLLEPARG